MKSQESKENNKLEVVKETKDEPKSNALANNIFKQKQNSLEAPEPVQRRSPPTTSSKRPTSKFVRVSKFKHLKGDVILKGKFENLKNLSRAMPAESNFFKVNPDRIAVPLTGNLKTNHITNCTVFHTFLTSIHNSF